MKASLIYCRQFQAVRSAKGDGVANTASLDVEKSKVVESGADSALLTASLLPQDLPAEVLIKEPKKRGRKPNPKKEVPSFSIEEKETILEFT
jgi:hypothetical protein